MSRLSTSQNYIQQSFITTSPKAIPAELPDWLVGLPGVSRVVDRLGVVEFRRRLIHMSPALLPIGLPFIPHADVWGPTLMGVLLLLSGLAFIFAMSMGSFVKRRSDESWSQAVIGYAIPVVGALLLFPGQAEFGLMTLQIIAVGDGSATLGGLMIGGPRLPWNRKKTYSGLVCFGIVGSLASTYSYWGEAHPVVSIGTAFLICGVAAISAAIVESLPIRSNDNFRVGTTALLVGIAMSHFVL